MYNRIWASCDWHLWNKENTSKHPYRSISYINHLAENYQKDIKPGDLWLYLGDLCDPEVAQVPKLREIISSIPGYKVMCRGNKDTETDDYYLDLGFDAICDVCKIGIIVFSHKPVKIDPDQINIHGHLHSMTMSTGDYQHINVYCDTADNHPTSLDDVLDRALKQGGEQVLVGIDQYFNSLDNYTQYRDILDLTNEYQITESTTTPMNEILFPDIASTGAWEQDDDYEPGKKKKEPMADGEGSLDESTSLVSRVSPGYKPHGKKSLTSFKKYVCDEGSFEKWYEKFRSELKHVRVNSNCFITLWIDEEHQRTLTEHLVAYICIEQRGNDHVIQALEVLPEYRGYGLSKQLMKYAKINDADVLYVDPDNKVAIKLYQDCGWKFGEDKNRGKLQPMFLGENAMRPNPPYFNKPVIYLSRESLNHDPVVCGKPFAEDLPSAVANTHKQDRNGEYYIVSPEPGYLDMRYSVECPNSWWSPDDVIAVTVGKMRFTSPTDYEIIEIANDDGTVTKLNEATIKFVNDKGVDVPKVCPKCGAKVGVFLKGEPVFLCTNKKCSKYFGTVPFNEAAQPDSLMLEIRAFNDTLNNYDYGYYNLKTHQKVTGADMSAYRTISPAEYAKYQLGVCWDFVEYEKYWFDRYFSNVHTQLYYLEANDKSNSTHTFLTFQYNGKWYWFESSWYRYRGIHEYTSESSMVSDVIEKFRPEKTNTVYALKFGGMIKYHLTPREYMKSIWKNGTPANPETVKMKASLHESVDAVDDTSENYLEPDVDSSPFGEDKRFFNHIKDFRDDYTLITESSYQFELEDHSLRFFDTIDESATNDTKLYPVYVMLIHSGSLLSNAIKTVTNSKFSHSVISFDSTFRNMYSFGRKRDANPFIGAFIKEDIKSKFYQDHPIPYAIYVVPCTAAQIAAMKKRLDYFIRNSTKFKYDFTGLFKNYFGIADNPEYKWFCSRFVADILNAGSPSDHPFIIEPSLMKPEDFRYTTFATYVTGGESLSMYEQTYTDKQTKRILRAEQIRRTRIIVGEKLAAMEELPLAESVICNLDRRDPMQEKALSYQLSMLDEASIDGFLQYLQSFKLHFNKQGDIIISRREYDQLDQYAKRSIKMLRTYEKAGNMAGVKDELCRVRYMILLIDQNYLSPKAQSSPRTNADLVKQMTDLRSVLLNVFQQYLRKVTEIDPQYNFEKSYNASIYGKDTKIPKAVLTALGKTVLTKLT